MSEKKIGVGIVGLSASGGWAATAHLAALRSLPDKFEIVALAASSDASAKAAAEKYDIGFHTADAKTLVERPEVELVVVTVKVPQHRELVQLALAAGKPVYCEWPLAKDASEAGILARSATSKGVRTFVGLQARAAPHIRFLRDLVLDGRIGTLLSTTVVASGGTPWGGTATSASAYATDRSTGASMLSIPFGHLFDALQWSLGDLADWNAVLATRRTDVVLTDTGGTVRATSPDQIALNGRLKNGAVASIHYRGGLSRGTNFLWEINGTEGDIRVTGNGGHLQFGAVEMKAGFGRYNSLVELAVPQTYQHAAPVPGTMGWSVAHAYINVHNDLIEGTRCVPDFGDAARLHELLDEIGRSGKGCSQSADLA